MMMKKIAMIMGSDSDLAVVQKWLDVLEECGVPYEVHMRILETICFQRQKSATAPCYPSFWLPMC